MSKVATSSSNVDIHQKELEVLTHQAKAEIGNKELEIQKLRQELSIKDKMLKEQSSDVQVRRLKAQLLEQTKSLEILELMKSEFAAMALGESYMMNQAYHDGQMFTYAEQQWEQLEEARRCESVLAEIRNEKMKSEMDQEQQKNLDALNSLVQQVSSSNSSARSSSKGVKKAPKDKERDRSAHRSPRHGSA